jgi:segregation and condensation protein A
MSDDPEKFFVALEGFEGPMELLLDLARAQKVDLAKISIVSLVDQYLAVIEGARQLRLELAADWLVMAAWLTWLKSRLLLPTGPEAEEAVESADLLAARLRELEAARAGALWLSARGVLGQDAFPRGAPENFSEIDRSGLYVDLPSLLRAYLSSVRRVAARRTYAPRQMSLNFWTVQDALQRLTTTLGSMPEWSALEKFLPADLAGQEHSAALASTLIASLELARSGGARLRQDAPFAPILVAAASANEP